MLQPYAWRRQLWRMAFFYAPFVLVGWLTNYLTLCLLLATLLHLGWHYRFQKRLSDWLWHDRSLVPPNGSGSWEYIFNGIYKLQQRHRARRRELAGLIRRFREGAEALPDAAVVFRTDGSILWCNRLAEQLLGFRWPEDAGQHIGNLIRNPAFVAYLGKGQYDEPFEMNSPINEEKSLEFRIMPYAEDQAMLVVRDVTRLRSLEKTRKHFVSNVSHELRTPLTVLKGYLEMTEEPPPPAMWAKAHRVMMEQTIRMDNLVNQLLTLSRIEAAPTVDLSHLVDMPAMLGLLEQEARALSGEHAHQIEFRVQPGLLVRGDRDQLRSAVSNLVYNAIHYTPAGRKISVEWRKQGAMALFAVQDEGEGIPPEHLARLTERFYRVDKARSRHTGGSGLGLAIVKHALSHHDAQLEIESQVGVGSRFSFLIPARMVVK
ncbi:phosphate regulon sensor protein PhoR [Aeromonas encheleia]|jgi:two-component system phosphate regulon sensor histidine kinase PhoR|uniref:Phosphate regulon sensor protein PhoR n=1 Tax=Aeromonas encheleia TaxID=73010 RepID=A0AAE9MG52_9GAMM|nr:MULTISPECIES: phosphate regulon sensor histidine kinase PhoR [Aeromonas]MBV7435765.1 phosphate regulon sensor histidine kinase PhoR [Aeromonas sp. sif2416]MBV7597619.1 phosphate regulon sensor histidine kinase PhoR [Aeromonas sp. sia0103]UNP89405.1 phosphate regulon sensor histidine kinase PhoR [Aeromonas encheleia]USV56638.1 phosphate regulon sensor histidine kinase PhoR [Aeromonas encheleia]VEG97534.1 phosphate regulon sensor protein PhoR [Aeromonas encheleia]